VRFTVVSDSSAKKEEKGYFYKVRMTGFKKANLQKLNINKKEKLLK
jgi:hypothetical protein